jgi:hypothetical protein
MGAGPPEGQGALAHDLPRRAVFPSAGATLVPMMRIRYVSTGYPGAPGLMTLYWTSPTEDASHAQEAVDHVRDFLNASVSNISNLVTHTSQAEVSTLNPATGALTGILATTVRSVVGTASQELMPGQVQGGMSLITNTIVRGRRLRGHSNLAGAHEGINSTGGVPSATSLTTWASASTNLITDTDPQLVVWSRPFLDGALLVAGSTGPVIAVSFSPKWFALRSRRD